MTPQEIVEGPGGDDPRRFPVRLFAPEFRGEIHFEQVPDEYAARLVQRVEQGLLNGVSRDRANYSALVLPDGGVQIRAHDFWTALNIGLNEIYIHRRDRHRITYYVTFRRWNRYGVVLGAAIAGVALGCVGIMNLFGATRSSPFIPDSWSMGSSALHAIVVAMAAFWGFIWPWILTEIHKKHAARCLDRILRECLDNSEESSAMLDYGRTVE